MDVLLRAADILDSSLTVQDREYLMPDPLHEVGTQTRAHSPLFIEEEPKLTTRGKSVRYAPAPNSPGVNRPGGLGVGREDVEREISRYSLPVELVKEENPHVLGWPKIDELESLCSQTPRVRLRNGGSVSFVN